MPEGQRPRGVTSRPRSGAANESTRLRQHAEHRREELLHVRGQGWWLGGATPPLKSGAVAESAQLQQHRSI